MVATRRSLGGATPVPSSSPPTAPPSQLSRAQQAALKKLDIAGTDALHGVLAAAAPDSVYTGPIGLVLVILIGIATVLLIRNMDRRLRRLPREFPPVERADTPPPGPAARPDAPPTAPGGSGPA